MKLPHLEPITTLSTVLLTGGGGYFGYKTLGIVGGILGGVTGFWLETQLFGGILGSTGILSQYLPKEDPPAPPASSLGKGPSLQK